MHASLPMYDWPEVRGATDALWSALRDALRARGIPAPEELSRDEPGWRRSDLVLSQTCGMPFRLGLHPDVTLIGAPDYGVEGCPPGFYRSVIVARQDDPRDPAPPPGRGPAGDKGPGALRFASNAPDSQSGWAALTDWSGPVDPHGVVWTGSHRESIRAVAAGRADVAAIDAVSWKLAQMWEPAARALRVVALTRPTPGLPFIAAAGLDPAPRAEAATRAIASLPRPARQALGLSGFVFLSPSAYLAP